MYSLTINVTQIKERMNVRQSNSKNMLMFIRKWYADLKIIDHGFNGMNGLKGQKM